MSWESVRVCILSQIDFQNQRKNGSSDDENEGETELDASKRCTAYISGIFDSGKGAFESLEQR